MLSYLTRSPHFLPSVKCLGHNLKRLFCASSILDEVCLHSAEVHTSAKGFQSSRVDFWRHLLRHAEFYCRNQDQGSLATTLGPPCPMLNYMHQHGCSIRSKLVRHDGGAALGGGKIVLALPGQKQVETAIIIKFGRSRQEDKATICVSSQAGCAMACRFCDTGLLGSEGGTGGINLPAWAILEQVLYAQAWLQREGIFGKSNVVFMGMGEPLLNYSNVLGAARLLCASDHKTTISTVGVVPRIQSLAKDAPDGLRLAVSLHAPSQELREELLPVAAKSWQLESLLFAVKCFEESTGSGVLFQYILIRGVNDGTEHASMLASLIGSRKLRCAGINLIPYNSTNAGAAYQFQSPSDSTCKRFRDTLRRLGAPNVTVRFSTKLGRDWASACGQLGLNTSRPLETA
ncbi:unnamed protein product [Durusdinium trenchii]|uniref:Radical SAM core domain-containing protein n=1 Tax=Durusdinium trenchii TaxID=1381693 RepID=A0ABP0SHG6_9DINO